MIPPSRRLGEFMPNAATLPYAALILLAGLWGPAALPQVLTGLTETGTPTHARNQQLA